MLIFLVGYMACGKSTIGRKLNKRLKLGLYDTDKEIVNTEKSSIAEIFDTHGEQYFRMLESDTINKLIDNNIDAIISTGGGAPMWGDNMKVMNQAGLTVYISRTAENIAKRVSAHGRDKRPKLRGLSDEELIQTMQKGIAERDERYREAQLIIEADNYTDEMILDTITAHIKQMEQWQWIVDL
ncbi:MAG: shikimate kinase [Rikenellaceae bacterium]